VWPFFSPKTGFSRSKKSSKDVPVMPVRGADVADKNSKKKPRKECGPVNKKAEGKGRRQKLFFILHLSSLILQNVGHTGGTGPKRPCRKGERQCIW
jgi:hypothetical protein